MEQKAAKGCVSCCILPISGRHQEDGVTAKGGSSLWLASETFRGEVCCMKHLAHWHKPSTAAGRTQVTTWDPFKISRIKKACM